MKLMERLLGIALLAIMCLMLLAPLSFAGGDETTSPSGQDIVSQDDNGTEEEEEGPTMPHY